MKAALLIQQKQHEIKVLHTVIQNNLTVREVVSRSFEEQSAEEALKELPLAVKFDTSQYVQGEIKFKNVTLHTHCPIGLDNSHNLMRVILKPIKNKDLFT